MSVTSLGYEAREIMEEFYRNTDVIYLDSRLARHDLNTWKHSSRVVNYAVMLGLINEFSSKSLQRLCLHDIGKLQIPVEILTKPTALTSIERKLMDEHPRFSKKIADNFSLDIVDYMHHEFDCEYSYPRHGTDRRIVIRNERRSYDEEKAVLAQLAAVADLYDALISERPYKPALAFNVVENVMADRFKDRINPLFLEQLFRTVH